jgi:hypothetical protein
MGWGKLKDRMRGKGGTPHKHGDTDKQRHLEEYLKYIETQASISISTFHSNTTTLGVGLKTPEEDGPKVTGEIEISQTIFPKSLACRQIFSEYDTPFRILFRGIRRIMYSVFNPNDILC